MVVVEEEEKVPPFVLVVLVPPSSRASAPMPLCRRSEAFSSSKETRRDLRSAEALLASFGMGAVVWFWGGLVLG